MSITARGFPWMGPVFRRRSARLVQVIVISALALSAPASADADPSTSTLEVSVHKGTMVRVSRPAVTVFVADPTIADVESRSQKSIFVYGKKLGDTTLMVLDENDKTLLNVTIHVTHDRSQLESLIKRIAPDAQISVSSVDGGIILEGSVEEPQEAEDIQNVTEKFLGDKETVLNRIAVTAPTQVNLRVRFAEVSKEVVRALGVSWSATDLTGNTQFNIQALRPSVTSAGSQVIDFAQQIGPVSLETTIDALEQEGLVSLLAEPNLTAISGETASFLAGGEFPIPVSVDSNSGAGGSTIGIEFKSYGVSLAFTPTVLSGDRISLHLRPEVSELSDAGAIILDGYRIPGLITRRADTTIELASGQSFIIGGLMQNRIANSIDKVPGLSDLPILGKLFQSRNYQANETELVIIATPYLVRPIGAGKKPLTPTDRPMSDFQFESLLKKKLADSGAQPDLKAAASSRIAGPVGFMVE
ncbi:type II and III secretion system protein family protein [Emcibacter sp. SYSU 3D8]|uniref:type II and III secretion system protein family protein n=1 Tax=Emcibacter sp. SYSU 3D8 TaxID=3133969 RepID=UPI0031FF37CC